MSIIKRKKQDKFFIMSNHATQENLTSLHSIGLLAYIKSLPQDWTLYKTFLQKKFTRRTVDSAWSELVEKGYIAGFSCYVDRKKRYYYLADDEPLTNDDFLSLLTETIEEIRDEGFDPKNLQPIKDNIFAIPAEYENKNSSKNSSDVQNVQHSKNAENSRDVRYVQHKEYSTSSTVPNVQVQINTHKEKEQINTHKEILKDVNNDINLIFDDLFTKYNDGLFSAKEWKYITDQLSDEIMSDPAKVIDLSSYLDSCIKNICYKRKRKLGIIPAPTVPFYNWLEN